LVDPTVTVIASVIAGIAGGFLSSWMAFNASGEEFNPRKHGNALITGALAGMFLGAAQASAAPDEIPNNQFILSLIGTFFAAAGIDRLRSSGSQMTTPAGLKKLAAGDFKGAIKSKEKQTTPTPAATPPPSPPAPSTTTTPPDGTAPS
jgi:hypothetical protein